MRTKVTLVLIFLNVALFFFIFKFERTWRTEAASLEARRRVLGPETADIRALEVTSAAAGGSFALQRQRDTWMLTKPLEWPANPHAVNTIIQELQLLEHEASFPVQNLGKGNNPTLADYGLDRPKLTVAFTSGDPAASNGPLAPTILRIGDMTKDGQRLYVLSPQGDRVHVVKRSLIESLTLPTEQLRSNALLTVQAFETRSLTVQTANVDQASGGATAGIRVRIRRDGLRWTFDAPHTARASRAAVESLINELSSLQPKTFNPPAPATLPSAAPTLRVTLEGNNRQETLFLGEPVAAPAEGATPPAEIEYYAQLENRPALLTVAVPRKLLETLRAAAESLREKQIIEFDPAAVTAITITAPSRNAPGMTLQRLESAENAAQGTNWQIVRRGGENEGVQTAPADRRAVENLLDRIARLSAQAFVSENPSSAELENWGFNRPEREIILTLASRSAAPENAPPTPTAAAPTTLTLRFGTEADRSRVYARVVSPADARLASFIYAVDVDLNSEFSPDPGAWRDRALPALPSNARVVALTLTDLATGDVLAEAAVQSNGDLAPDTPHAPALATILAQLRAPRAKSFYAETFAERVMVRGEELPWKYQIDATVVLPGGAATEQAAKRTLFVLPRTGGAEQLAGSRDFDVIFGLEQPFIDALWQVTHSRRDPGPPPAPAK